MPLWGCHPSPKAEDPLLPLLVPDPFDLCQSVLSLRFCTLLWQNGVLPGRRPCSVLSAAIKSNPPLVSVLRVEPQSPPLLRRPWEPTQIPTSSRVRAITA